MHILAELTPYDPVTGTRPTVRASSAQDRRITGLNGVKWWPAISAVPALAIRLFDGDFSSNVEPGEASLTLLSDKLAKADANVGRYQWAGAKLTLYAGEATDSWPWDTVFVGVVSRFEGDGNRLKLGAKVDTEPFEKDALTATYAGTGGAEGDANLKNRVKPWLFGRCFNVEPVMINAVDNVFQFSAYGPIQAVNALYERASDFGASIGNYASYAALVAATIRAGEWGTCLAEGLVRLGAPPYGVITGDVDGDKPAGTWLRKTGEIIQRIASNASIDAALVDTASLNALDTALAAALPNDGRIGLYLADQASVIDVARRLARPCNAQAGISWLGKLFAVRVAIGTPAVTLDAQGRRAPGVISSVEVDVSAPYWRIEMGAERAWRVHSFDEIAFFAPLVDRGPYDDAETYREGNIVQDQGSSWLYINPAATSGNDPPILPTSANAYWQLMAGAGAAAKVIAVNSNRQAFTFDGGANLSPGTQSAIVTASPQNFVGGNVVWSYEDNLGTSSAALSALVTATSTNVRTVPSSAFTGTSTRTWLRVIATGQGAEAALSDAVTIVKLQDGAPVLTMLLSNEAHNVPTAADGTGGDFSGAVGTIKVFWGAADVTATATLSEVSETGCTGDVNTATNTPVNGQAKGYYRVTALSADTAAYKMQAVYNPGSGNITVQREFTLAKAKAGTAGTPGTNAKVVSVEADRGAFTFDGGGNLSPGTQSSVVTANPQNFVGGDVVWSYADNLGTASATLAALVTATSANVRTVPSTVFTGTPTRTWLKVTATGQGAESSLSDSTTILKLQNGSGVLSVQLSNEAATVPTDSVGAGGDFSGAIGQMTVWYGATDVTATATISEVSETNCTGLVNASTNSAFTGAKGAYKVTALSANTGIYKMRAVYDPGSGNITVDREFTLSKSLAGATGGTGPTGPTGATGGVRMVSTDNSVLVVSGNTLSSTASAWNHVATSMESMVGSAAVGFRLDTNGLFVVGLTRAALVAGASAGSTPDYSWYCQGVGSVWAFYDNDGYVGSGGDLTGAHPTAAVGDFPQTIYVDGQIRWYMNGELRRVKNVGVGWKFYAGVQIHSGKITDLTFGAAPASLSFGDRGDSLIYDDFTYDTDAAFKEKWAQWQAAGGSGEFSTISDGSTPGGKAVRIGNNAGNDQRWLYWIGKPFPIEPDVLYEMTLIVKRATGSGVIYAGIEGMAADQVTMVNVSGADDHASQHYIAAAGAAPGTSWTVYRGFFKGRAGTGDSTAKADPTAPGVLHTNAVNGRPMMLVNNSAAAGQMDLGMLRIRKLDGLYEINADVTSTINGPTEIIIECDYLGVPISGELTKTTSYKLFRNGVQITASITWSRTALSGTSTTAISGSGTATFDVSAITTDSVVRISAAYAGTTRVLDVTIRKNLAPPPSGGTGGSGNPGTTASDTSIANISSSTYSATHAGPLTVKAGTAGQVDCTAPLSFKLSQSTAGGPVTAYGKWQWRAVGGSWADITTEITGSVAAENLNEPPVIKYPGNLSVAMTKTGLTSGVDYEFQLLLRGDVATACYFYGGSATAAGS